MPSVREVVPARRRRGPDGEPLGVEERLAEILRRYPSEHVVHQAISVAAPDIVAAVRRVEARLSNGHR